MNRYTIKEIDKKPEYVLYNFRKVGGYMGKF